MRLVRDPKMVLLANLPLFAGCTDAELAVVSAAADLVTVPKHLELAVQGDRADHVYVIVDGMVQVRAGARVLAYLSDGAVVGELGPLDGARRTATVTTMTETRLLLVERRHLAPLLGRAPRVAERLEAIAAPRRVA